MSGMGKDTFKEDLMHTIGQGKNREVRLVLPLHLIIKAVKWIQKKLKGKF